MAIVKSDGGTDYAFIFICVVPWIFTIGSIFYSLCELKKDDDIHEPFEGNDMYEDLTVSSVRALMLGFTQCVLVLFYVDGMQKKLTQLHHEIEVITWCNYNVSDDCVDESEYNYYYWTAVFVQFGYLIGFDAWNSTSASVAFWNRVCKLLKKETEMQHLKLLWKPSIAVSSTARPRTRKLEFLFRGFCSVVVNTAALYFIILALPLQVAVGSPGDPEVVPLDFVLNVIAAFFIIDIDNLSVPRVFQVVEDKEAQKQEQEEEFFSGLDLTSSTHISQGPA